MSVGQMRMPRRSRQTAYSISATTVPADINNLPYQNLVRGENNRLNPPPRAAAEAYWRQNFIATPDSAVPEPPRNIFIANEQNAPARAVTSAFWIDQRYFMIEEVPMMSGDISFTDIASRGPSRASPWCYWLDQRFFFIEEVPMMSGDLFFSDSARAPQRASADSYVVAATFPVDNELAIASSFTPHTVTRNVRASATAFQIVSTFPPAAEPQTQRQSVPDFARGKRRPAATAFIAAAQLVIQDEPQLLRQSLPVAAPAARRGPQLVYIVSQAASPTIDTPATRSSSMPDSARTWPRTAPAAFWVDARFTNIREEPMPTLGLVLGHTAPGVRRPSSSAYWVDNATQGYLLGETPPLEIRIGILAQNVRALPRVASSAFWFDNRPQTAEDAPLPFASTSIVTPAYSARRAASQAYGIQVWIDQEEMFSARATLPHQAKGPARPAAEAYWHGAGAITADPTNPAPQLLPDRAPLAPRSPTAAYGITVGPSLYDLGESPSIEIRVGVSYPSQARANARAAASAYFQMQTPPIQSEQTTEIVRGISVPDVARAPQRASPDASWINQQVYVDQPPPGSNIGYQELRPNYPRRASAAAYGIAFFNSALFVTPPASQIYVLEAGMVYVAGMEAGCVFVAGAEAGEIRV